ncbi:MAG TPA: HAMP domain-containing sensor histidine kinase [Streptosporangiaceae bacterium]|nr:HAMP domain-containing sensor histidine kinase [Streptosporangiaceae bacterium]
MRSGAAGAARSGAAGAARRRPVRLRLTLVYSGLFLAAGAILLAVTYGLVAQSFDTAPPATPSSQPSQYVGQALKACKAENLDKAAMGKCVNLAEQSLSGVSKASLQDQRSRTLAHLLDYSLAALAALVFASTWLGWIVAGRALRPVHAITAAARRASEENLGERIALAGPDDELKELADTFDAMLGRLDAAFASQRRFVADASHELRTPLTVMRTSIDVTLAKPGRTPAQLEAMAVEVRHAADRAETLIEALLTLARSDRGTGPTEPLDVAALAEDALDAAAPAIRAHPVTVQTALDPAPAMGDPVLLERLVTNLIDNAVRHNVPGGWVQVATGTREGMAFIDVANGGPLIPAELVPALFEPFRRLSDRAGSPDGMGLGLSIVRSVALAHRGQATARPRPAGGLEVTVSLPGCA